MFIFFGEGNTDVRFAETESSDGGTRYCDIAEETAAGWNGTGKEEMEMRRRIN